MSVHITDHTSSTWQYAHDEGGHSGDFDQATLSYGTNIDGTTNRDVVLIVCPEGDGLSYWPRETLAQDIQEKLPA
jgi:hypothetical protein